MKTEELLPTDFAISLLEDCGLLEVKKSGLDTVARYKMEMRVAQFQRMAICTTFESAMVAFFGYEINEKQKEILKIIYESTKPWIMGLTVDACLNAITYKVLSKNEFAEAVKTIVEQTNIKKGETTKRMKGILVNVSKRE